ncbi:hypothetical protein JCM1841_005907 [Sporobolomyces salmonicolor]
MPYTASFQAVPPPAPLTRPPSYRSRAPCFYSAAGSQGPTPTAGLLESQELSGDGEPDDYAPPCRSLRDCASTFHDQTMESRRQLDPLRTTLSQILAVSTRLLITKSAFESPARRGCLRFAGMTGEEVETELEERGKVLQGLVRRFRRRVKELKREARGEKDERRAASEEKREPKGVEDYLAGGVACPNLLTKDAVHASPYLVTNPFTILVRNLTDNLNTLRIPQMVAAAQNPSTFMPPARPSSCTAKDPLSCYPYPLPSNPTPAGSDANKSLSQWKSDIPCQKPAKKDWVDKGFDEIDGDVREGAREIGGDEIIFLTLALFPILLVATPVETFLGSAASSGPYPIISLKSLRAPIMPSSGGEETESSVAGATETTTTQLRLRRRASVDADAELV